MHIVGTVGRYVLSNVLINLIYSGTTCVSLLRLNLEDKGLYCLLP